MNPVVTCDTCKGTGRTPVRQTICPCAKPCSKCSLMDKTKSGHCRICSSQNSKRYSVNLAKNQVVCAHCGKCDRVKSGHCGPCRRDYINQNWPQTLIRTTRKNSRRRGHSPATITSEWILEQFQLQNGKCFYTSMLLDSKLQGRRALTQPSLDRIDNAIGYTPENTRLTSLGWNQLRNDSSIEETLLFITRCKLVT